MSKIIIEGEILYRAIKKEILTEYLDALDVDMSDTKMAYIFLYLPRNDELLGKRTH